MKISKLSYLLVFLTLALSSYGQYDFEVEGSIKAQRISLKQSIRLINDQGNLAFNMGERGPDISLSAFDGGFFFNTGDRNFVSSATPKLTISDSNNNGNIGIGTTRPNSKLHLEGGKDASLLGHGYLLLGELHESNLVIDNNEILARKDSAFSELFLQKDGGDLLLCGDENGQVGIGITTSANLPHPDYLLAVDGKIATEDILVEPSGNWPDYVFEESYDLKSIEELEASIQQNGHLPGLPSAEDIEEDGQHLGEIQLLLLEKIEELSLYIIQQNKMLLEQQKELEELRVKIEHSHK